MCETQECTGVEPLATVQEADPESPGCLVSEECDWGNYKRQEGPGWCVSLRQSRKGFKCHAIADCLLPVSPAAGYDILTDPEVKQWRQVKECTYRKVWEDDGNIQKVEVEQSATAFFKTIYTRMHVVQDRAAGTMHFSLAKPGMLKFFEGQWTVSAVEGDSHMSHVHLEQTMQPGFAPPPPFKRFFRKAMISKATQMLIQLQEEAERSATSVAETPASMPAGKSGQLGHQLSFDITAHAGPALASPAPEPRQEHCQPVPATPEASAHMHSHAVVASPPTDVLFASWKILVESSNLPTAQHSTMWKRMAVPARAHSAQQGLISHPICCDSDSE